MPILARCSFARTAVAALLPATVLCAGPEDFCIVKGLTGIPGGRLVFAQRAEPKTFNPLVGSDNPSREVFHRLMGDLIHINRYTQQTEPGLAKSWTVSPDGLHYILELRRGVRFSDGQPFDADDVVFTFQAILDEKVSAPQRDLLILDGKPIAIHKLDAHRVQFDLPAPYAVVDRLFDGFGILPRHLLERAWKEGKLVQAWTLRTPPAEIAGLGPFRLKEYVPGERVVLERNPYYWKADASGARLPYLAEVQYVFAGTEDGQVMRFQAGESDMISRISPKNYAVLEKDQQRRGYTLQNLGPGLEYSFLFFNLGDLSQRALPQVAAHQEFFRRVAFRRAISMAVDRDAMVKLAYLGYATPLAGPVPPGDKGWVNAALPRIVRSVADARSLLAADGFAWARDGALLDPKGRPVEFSIVTSANNAERVQMATLIQADLKELGMNVHVVPLEFRSLLDRVLKTHDYEACLLSLSEGDADPNSDMSLWLSSGGTHLWNPEQAAPATPWEAEIDALMRKQISERKPAARKAAFDRVQELAMQKLPLIPLVSPNILVGARKDLGNFRPSVLDHYTLWNIEELCWRNGSGARR
ncbi:MAG TPA: ABC transporter substrate-binding protein [Bryobacteraceae bacterium]|jgi:peptide/nickel transport system substrate-binding protein